MIMPKRPIIIIIFFILLFSTVALGFSYTQRPISAFWNKSNSAKVTDKKGNQDHATTTKKKEENIVKKVDIESGSTYTDLMTKAGLSRQKAMDIYAAASSEYDLADLDSGKCLELTYTPKKERLKSLLYKVDTQKQLKVKNTAITDPATTSTTSAASTTKKISDNWEARMEPIPYKTETVTAQGEVESSLYKAAQKEGLDVRTIIKFAEALQWTVDFAMETRKGDTFKLVYEKKYLNGEYVRPGRIWAARYVNAGDKHEIFYYKENKDNKGYFTYEGKSAQKMFLKAPVAYKYISSGYTSGPRYLARFQRYTDSHQAIDYAAENGTPIRSVGSGTVTRAGWSSAGYGYLTAIRHNSTYTTRYAHQSKILVSPGEHVKQGEVIGYVGSTGLSTGPHLHYEIWKHGVKTNPLNLELPPSDSIDKENMEDFHEFIRPYKKKLEKPVK